MLEELAGLEVLQSGGAKGNTVSQRKKADNHFALQPLIDVSQASKAFGSQDYKAKAPLPKEEVEDTLPRASPLFGHLTHLAFFHVSTLAKVSKKEADDGKSL